MKAAEKNIADAESAFRAFEAFRSGLDDNLAKPGSARTLDVVEGFSPAITGLIEVAANKLRLTLETLTSPPTVALTQLVGLRHLTALMAENAGRERAFLGGVVGPRTKLTADGLRKVAGFRGHVDLAWETIAPIRRRADTSAKIVDAIGSVENEYFKTYGDIRDGVLAAGETGEYKITGSDYVDRATVGINAILRLADAIGSAADQEAASEAARSLNLIVNVAILLAGVGLALVSFWVAFFRILRPLFALTGAMRELANGHFVDCAAGSRSQGRDRRHGSGGGDLQDQGRAEGPRRSRSQDHAGSGRRPAAQGRHDQARRRFRRARSARSSRPCRRPRPNWKLPPAR